MAYTLIQAKENLQIWIEAERKLAIAQSYTIGSRTLTRTNLSEVVKRIEYWKNQVAELEMKAQGKRMRRTKQFIPHDF